MAIYENAREDLCWLAFCKHEFQVLIITIIIIIIFFIFFFKQLKETFEF